MNTPYAQFTRHRCPMHDASCAARVADLVASRFVQPFTAEQAMALIEQQVGRYVRGPHAGQLRGWAHIEVCERGGWVKDGPGYHRGHVERPGQIRSIHITDFTGRVLFSA